MSVTENEAARQARWQAGAGRQPASYDLPFWEGDTSRPLWARCDGCGRAADLEEMVQGRDCTLFCPGCVDARTDGGWEPEEFFAEGGDL